jgi:hypothetical protein
MIPDPLIFDKPFHLWLGLFGMVLLLIQAMVGKHIIKLPLWVHSKLIWITIFLVAVVHGYYGIQIYFFK